MQKERTQVMKDFIDEQLNRDFDQLYHMSDRQLAEEFPKLHQLYILTMESGGQFDKLNGRVFNLDPEYQEKLANLKLQHQGLLSGLKVRFEAIANLNYEIFHFERMQTRPEQESYQEMMLDTSEPVEGYTGKLSYDEAI